MKKVIVLLLTALILLTAVSCKKNNNTGSTGDSAQSGSNSGYGVAKEYLNNMEYSAYQDIFYNQTGSKYEGKTFEKEGIFTTIHDSFNNVERYYVWGFNDNTHCCDYQWELNITDTSSLPKNGSFVKFSGSFKADSKALDGYWFTEPKITVEQEFTGQKGDIDMTTMSATLARVQLINMLNYPDEYAGKTVTLIGRVMSPTTLQHPYYDEAWTLNVKTDKALPAIGKWVVATGTFSGTSPENCVLTISEYTEVNA